MCWRRSSAVPGINLALAAAAACGAFWEFLGYFEVPPAYHTMIYAVLGVAVLAVSRFLGIEQVVVDRYPDPNTTAHSRQGTEGLSDGKCDRLGGTAGRVPARLDAVGLSQGGSLARRRAGDGHPRGDHGRRAGARRILAAMVHHRGHRHGRRDIPHARRTHRPEHVAEGRVLQCRRRHPARRGQLCGPLPRDDRLRERRRDRGIVAGERDGHAASAGRHDLPAVHPATRSQDSRSWCSSASLSSCS